MPAHDVLRPPEIGTVMVRGRAGATGAPFNLGEMTVTRATVRLAAGAVGHGHVQGRDKDAARVAALIDALCEGGEADALETAILAPLRAEAEAGKRSRAAKAAATKVEFFHDGARRERMTEQYLEGGFADPPRAAAHAFSRSTSGAEPPGPDRDALGRHTARALFARRGRTSADALRRDHAGPSRAFPRHRGVARLDYLPHRRTAGFGRGGGLRAGHVGRRCSPPIASPPERRNTPIARRR